MRSIAPTRLKIHLPLFDWAERHRVVSPPSRMRGFCLDRWLSVHPVWEASHDR